MRKRTGGLNAAAPPGTKAAAVPVFSHAFQGMYTSGRIGK